MKKLPKILNKAELARAMWPDKSAAPVLLNTKLTGANYNRITQEDKEAIVKELEKAIEEVKSL
ncbi:hypothetical protein ACR777_10400 [Sphingobacterium spiritivorum]|uniref:hypothetical protein n=1 Tax=Sphingobacterium spiritivorum TaxID=258 RepID=UPI003DA6B226